ncbi:CoA transferase [Alicyclobacillaceae bacterium I2511]|nr:CoA transferase [Alicyclobacillaceae bacterium I2511]
MGIPALKGIRVLEIGNLVAAPSAGRILADFGADVIKVEPPEGDPLRKWGRESPTGSSWWWHMQARNKRLVAVDLKSEAGRGVVRNLAGQCDLLIENLRPGRLNSWGLGYADLIVENPGLIYITISGYGLTGPYKDRPGFGHIAESMGGIRHVTGYPDQPPVRTGISLGDEVAALQAVIGGLMALYRREVDPNHRGDYVDVALTESILALTEAMLPEYLQVGIVQERTGNQLLRAAPSNIYPTVDKRWVAIGANTTKTFASLVNLMGKPELAMDSRYQTNPDRVAHVSELDDLIAAWTAQKSLQWLLTQLNNSGVPAGPVMTAKDMAEDAQFLARDMILHVPDANLGAVGMPGVVPKLVRHGGEVRCPGGALGQNTKEVLRDILKISDEKLQELEEAGVIRA